jgi:uncharacterized protein YndB with AHSA1/START domain
MMQPIEHELRVKADAPAAYRAIATPEGIQAWWAKDSRVGTAKGEPVELQFNKPDMTAVMKFTVSDIQPDRRVEWTCTENTNPIWPGSKLAWEVQPSGSGSAVRFRHDGFSDGGPPYDMTVQGWQLFIDSLRAYLDGGTPAPSE